MECNIVINNKIISATKGETILDSLQRNGIYIPTLCNIKNMFPTGACRLCMVENKKNGELVPACSEPVEPDMIIETHSNKVTNARKTIIELLLARHPDDCLYCERNSNCELQVLAYEMNVREKKINSVKKVPGKDLSSQAIQRDPSKCVLCGRCVRICRNIIGCNTLDFAGRGNEYSISTPFNQRLNTTNCINCGQCIVACPTAAIFDKNNILPIQKSLSSYEKTNIVFYDPLLPLALQLHLGKKSKNQIEFINGILYSMGFHEVKNLNYIIDLYIIAVAKEFYKFVNENENPVFYTSYCPAWVKYAEQYYHDDLQNLSQIQTPSLLFGNIIKNDTKTKNTNQFVVCFEPCTARKFESRSGSYSESGFHSVDVSATFREFFQMMRIYGIQPDKVLLKQFDSKTNINSSSSILLNIQGGLLTSVCRVLLKLYPNEVKMKSKVKLENGKIFKKLTLKIKEKEIVFVSVSGMLEATKTIDKLKKNIENANFIEVLACPHGCINGGGLDFGLDKESQVRFFNKIISEVDQSSNFQNALNNESAFNYLKDKLENSKEIQRTYKKRTII